jgi:hypothetical protein
MKVDRIVMALAVAAGAVILWWAIIGRPASNARQAVTARAQTVVADQRGAAAADAARIIHHHHTETIRVKDLANAARAEIAAAPDAAAAHAAAVRAVCLLSPPPGGADNPACQLPGPRAGGSAG